MTTSLVLLHADAATVNCCLYALGFERVTEAVELGMYGAPFIKIESPAAGDTPMVCFGSDRFEQLAFANGWTWVGPDPSRTTRVGAKL